MQRVNGEFRLKPLTRLVFIAVCAVGAQAAQAQAVDAQAAVTAPAVSGDLGSVQSTAAGDASNRVSRYKRETAPANAPAQASLQATEPQSIITRKYIEQTANPTASYADIISIAPSVMVNDPNGSGLMEASKVSIRGFQDGQYNVTFDGIPFGDSNDFTHHSTSFFTNQQIGSIDIDRGPGTAKQIGFATFGGTIAIDSKDPSNTPGVTLFGSVGSWDTIVGGAEFNTGVMQNWGDAKVMVGGTMMHSDGYLTNTPLRRENFYFKLEKPIGNDTVVTVYANYNNLRQSFSAGASAAEIAKYGPSVANSDNPQSQSYYGYNFDKINTDMEYVDVRTHQSDWTLDNKVYTYAYYHPGWQTTDATGMLTTKPPKGIPNVTDPWGTVKDNNYRAWGDVFDATRDLGPGTLDAGVWFSYQSNFRDKLNIDMLENFAQIGAPKYNMQDQFTVVQPYVQYDYKLPQYGLTITPGVRYEDFTRHIEAAINQTSGAPIDYTEGWHRPLLSLNLHEQITQNWSAYAQYAQGFLAPNLNVLYTTNLSGQPSPEQTNNYQIGTVFKTDRFTFDADLYYINFINLIQSQTIAGESYFYNAGGAIYKGIETEGTVSVGYGFNLYANATLNSAKQKGSQLYIQNAPSKTAAFGVIYDRGPFSATAMLKYIGDQYGDTSVSNAQHIGGYTVTNLSARYTLPFGLVPWVHDTKVGLDIDNIFNRRSIDGFAGYNGDVASTPLYWTIPGRAIIGTFQTSF